MLKPVMLRPILCVAFPVDERQPATHPNWVPPGPLKYHQWPILVAHGIEFAGNAGDPDLIPWSGRSPWRREWQHTPVLLPGTPRTEEPGGLLSLGSQRVGHDGATKHADSGAVPRPCRVPGPWLEAPFSQPL